MPDGTKKHPMHAKTVLRKRKTILGYLQHLEEVRRHAEKQYKPLDEPDHEHQTSNH